MRALRYIPSILRLHRALFQKYQRKLDKAEASQITVAQLKRGLFDCFNPSPAETENDKPLPTGEVTRLYIVG